MKKRNIILLIIGFILITGIYFGYKGFILYYYNINNNTSLNYLEFVNGLKVKDTISINHNESNIEYLEFNGAKIRNDFKKFTKLGEPQSTKDSSKYVLYDKNNNLIASFWIGTGNTYTSLLKNDVTLFGTDDKRVSNGNLIKILEKNNINNDIDLFKYISEYTPSKNNIFTSAKKIKEDFDIQFMTFVALPEVNYITEINGDYTGYIFNMNNDYKEVSILKNDKRYIFMFFKAEYFTDEYLKELLDSVVIE